MKCKDGDHTNFLTWWELNSHSTFMFVQSPLSISLFIARTKNNFNLNNVMVNKNILKLLNKGL